MSLRVIATRNTCNLKLQRTISMPSLITKNELNEYLEKLDFVEHVKEVKNENGKSMFNVWVHITPEDKDDDKNEDYLSVLGEKGISNAWKTETIEKYLKQAIFTQHTFINKIYMYNYSDVKYYKKLLRCYMIEFE